jgi:hypothetical protein
LDYRRLEFCASCHDGELVTPSCFCSSIGGGRNWACVASLIETCKLNGVEPYAYLQDILTRLVAGHPVSRLDELLPWNWKANLP